MEARTATETLVAMIRAMMAARVARIMAKMVARMARKRARMVARMARIRAMMVAKLKILSITNVLIQEITNPHPLNKSEIANIFVVI